MEIYIYNTSENKKDLEKLSKDLELVRWARVTPNIEDSVGGLVVRIESFEFLDLLEEIDKSLDENRFVIQTDNEYSLVMEIYDTYRE